jgi:acetyl esterase/lipase
MSLLLALRERDLPGPAGAALLCPWVDQLGRFVRTVATPGESAAPQPG